MTSSLSLHPYIPPLPSSSRGLQRDSRSFLSLEGLLFRVGGLRVSLSAALRGCGVRGTRRIRSVCRARPLSPSLFAHCVRSRICVLWLLLGAFSCVAYACSVTKLGRLVRARIITTIEEIYLHSIPIKEHQIVDLLLPGMPLWICVCFCCSLSAARGRNAERNNRAQVFCAWVCVLVCPFHARPVAPS